MPNITCPKCGEQVSDHAVACPKCGHHFIAVGEDGIGRRSFRFSWMAIAGILLIIGLFALIGTCNWKPV